MKSRMLVAMDASDKALKAVEYVGDTLSGSRELDITLFHVLDFAPETLEHGGSEHPVKETRLNVELVGERQKWIRERQSEIERKIFVPAKRILEGKGIRAESVSTRTELATDGKPDVADALIKEIRQGRYGTVVLGRRRHSMLRDCLIGSTTEKVSHGIEDCTVWIVG